MIEIEEELRSQLRRRAEEAPVSGGGGWAAINGRVERRGRARRVRRAGLTVAAVVVLCAGALSLVGSRDGTPVATSPATGALPHLVFDVPGYEPTHVFEMDPANGAPEPSGGVGRAVGPATGSVRLSVLVEPDRGYDGRLLFVSQVAPGASFGFGELDPDAQRVAIGDRTGYLRDAAGAPVRTLGWQLASGEGGYLVGVRLTREELVSVARAMELRAGGDLGWAGGTVPAGLTVQRTTVTPYEPRAESSVVSASQENRLTLRLQAGGPEVLDSLVADRVASALEVAAVSVDGVPAIYTGAETIRGGLGSTSLIWPVRDGVVAELVADGAARQHLVTAAASLRTVSDARWRELLAASTHKTVPVPWAGVDAQRAALSDACSRRTAWLDARRVGDVTTQTRVMASLSELFRRGSDEGWGKDSDILVILKLLVDAMKAGDTATVQATPAGGCP